MKRKILQAGPTTLTISLPMSWVKKFNLKKGQELEVEEQGSALKILTKNIHEEDLAVINASSLYPISTKIIGAMYKAGYKRIKVYYTPNRILTHRGKEQKEVDMIKTTFDHLNGMQLWDINKDKDGNFLSVTETSKPDTKEFKNILNKLLLCLSSQAELISNSFDNKEDIFDEASLNERLINQTADLCIKILIIKGHEEYRKTTFFYDFILRLESIGDDLYSLSYELKNNKSVKIKTKEALKKINHLLKKSEDIYKNFNQQGLINLIKETENLNKDFKEKIMLQNNKGVIEFYVYSLINKIIDLIESHCFMNYDYFKRIDQNIKDNPA